MINFPLFDIKLSVQTTNGKKHRLCLNTELLAAYTLCNPIEWSIYIPMEQKARFARLRFRFREGRLGAMRGTLTA